MRSTLGRFLLCLAVLLVPAAARAGTFAPAQGTEQQVLGLLNQIREQHHLGALAASLTLRAAARAHSADMLRIGYFGHDSPTETFEVRLSHYLASPLIGETIARGAGSSGTPAGLVTQWMHSASHRAVILTPGLHRVGIGAVIGTFDGSRGVVMATADFAA